MALAEYLEPAFAESARVAGAELHQLRRVKIQFKSGRQVFASVRDQTRSFPVSVGMDEAKGPKISCNCPSFTEKGPCPHVWAVVLEVDQRGMDLGKPPAEGTPKARKRAPWADRLRGLVGRARGEANALLQSAAAQAPEIRWTMEVSGDAVDAPLRLRALGAGEESWRPDKLERLSGTDRKALLLLLAGGEVELPSDQAIELSPGHVEELLPLLGPTGRLFLAGDEESPLLYNEEPWTLGLSVVRDAKEKVVRLEAWYRRGSERLLLPDVEALPMGLLLRRGEIAPRDDRGAGFWLHALREEPLEAPLEDEAALIEEVLQMARLPLLDLPDREIVTDEPAPRLAIGPASADGSHPCELSFDYGGRPARLRQKRALVGELDERRMLLRDTPAELQALRRLVEAGAKAVADEDQTADAWLPEACFLPAVRSLLAEGWRVEAEGREWRGLPKAELQVASGDEWFELSGHLRFGDAEVPLGSVLGALRRGEEKVQLPDGSMGLLPAPWVARWRLAQGVGKAGEEDGSLRIGTAQGWLVEALLAGREDSEVQGDPAFEEWRGRLAAAAKVDTIVEPETFQGELRGYQREGLGWFRFLRGLGFGGCLADDMGLGKTVQVLALLAGRKEEDEARLAGASAEEEGRLPNLVIVPRSVVFNWMDEAKRFVPHLKVVDYTGPTREEKRPELPGADIILTTYGVLRNDADDLEKMRFDYVILDEAQAVKNEQSLTARAARRVRARHRLALTGTPVQNRIGELWALFDFLNPGMLGNATAFRREMSKGSAPSEQADLVGTLATALRPFLLRRRKAQVAPELPDRIEQTIWCELTPAQRSLYEQLREDAWRSFGTLAPEDLLRQRMNVLEALLRLRQTACHPGLVDPGLRSETSAKLEVLLPRLQEIADQGEKVLVFSQFTSLLELVRERLDELQLPHSWLTGETRDRAKAVRRFQEDPRCPIFLISLRAGGMGLNLTAASYVFLLDPWWNPAVEQQAIDRAWRIGQTRRVFAFRLIGRNTVEEKVMDLQRRKRALVDTILTDANSDPSGWSAEDLLQLFS